MSRPGGDRNLFKAFLNERCRTIVDRRPWWTGLVKPIVVPIPAAYTTGTVQANQSDYFVTGTGTNWPTNDVVNTTVQEIVPAAQAMWVTPASMVGITRNTVLYVDPGTGGGFGYGLGGYGLGGYGGSGGGSGSSLYGVNPEICPVLDIIGNRVLLNFAYAHPGGFSVWASSLNGRQFRTGAYGTPIYTVISVTSPTLIVLDQQIGLPIGPTDGYSILLMYIILDPQCKDVMTGTDPFQQIDLAVKVPQSYLNQVDPDRQATNSPVCISPRSPNVNGLMTWEIWPPSYIQYQLNFQIRLQWPDMRVSSDYPPPFINPNALIYGALADAFRTPCPRPPDYKDPGFSLEAADRYEAMFEKAVMDLMEAEEARNCMMFTYDSGTGSMGSDFARSHAYGSDGFPIPGP